MVSGVGSSRNRTWCMCPVGFRQHRCLGTAGHYLVVLGGARGWPRAPERNPRRHSVRPEDHDVAVALPLPVAYQVQLMRGHPSPNHDDGVGTRI